MKLLLLISVSSFSVVLSNVIGMNLYLDKVGKTENVSVPTRERMNAIALNCGLYGAAGCAASILLVSALTARSIAKEQEREAVKRYANRAIASGKDSSVWSEVLGEVMSHE